MYNVDHMGAWGFNPIQNDGGLDELALLFEKSRLFEHASKSLLQDLHECPDEIRATAFLIYTLAKNGLWPHDSLKEATSLAISRLSRMLGEQVYTNANFEGELRHLVNQLRKVEPTPDNNRGHPNCEL